MVVSEIHVPSSPLPMSRSRTTSSASSGASQGSGVYRRTISRSSSRSTRRRELLAKPECSELSAGNEGRPPSGHVRRDSHRFTDRSRASSLPRPHTATVKSSRPRILSRTSESSRALAVHIPEKPEIFQKRPVTSKEILIYLYKAWQPQLCPSYRKSVLYQPTDPLQLQAFMDALLLHKDNKSYFPERFKVVGKVAQVVSMLNHHDHVDVPTNDTGSSRSRESHSSSSQSVNSNDGNPESPSLPSIPSEKQHIDVLNNEQHPGYSQSFESTTDKLPYLQHRRSVDHISIDLTPKTKRQLLLKSYSDGNFNTV